MPTNTVYVGRPSKWGNHFRSRLAARIFRYSLLKRGRIFPSGPTIEDIKRTLAGKDLACWCPLDASCHADVLLEIANGDPYAG